MKKFLITFFALLVCFGLSALSPDLSAFGTALVSDDDDEDDEEEEESAEESSEEEEKAPKHESDAEFFGEQPEEDPFAKGGSAKPEKQKDDFVQGGSQNLYPDPEEDDFVVEKREKGVVILEDKKAVFATRQYIRQTGPLERAQSLAHIKVLKRMEF